MFVAVLDPLLRSLRDLKFGADGRLITADGRTLDGLQVVGGTHPRPGTSYRVVTRTDFAKYDAELVADDAHLFQLGVEGHGSPVQVSCTLPEPHQPTRLDFALSGHIEEMRPIRGAITGSAKIALTELPPARGGKPQLTAEFRHRYAAGRLAVTVTQDADDQWLAMVDVRLRFRGVFLLATPFSAFFRTKLQRELDAFDPAELTQFVTTVQDRFGSAPDPSAMAAAAVDALLAYVAETIDSQPD